MAAPRMEDEMLKHAVNLEDVTEDLARDVREGRMLDYSDRESLQGLYYALYMLLPDVNGETGADALDEILDAAEDQQDAADMVANFIFDMWETEPQFIEICSNDADVSYNVGQALKTAGGVFHGVLKQMRTEITRYRMTAA